MDFVAVVDQAIALLRQRGRLTYRTLQLQFQLDAEHLAALTDELIKGQRLATDEVKNQIGDSQLTIESVRCYKPCEIERVELMPRQAFTNAQGQVRSFYVYDPDDIILPFDSGLNEE